MKRYFSFFYFVFLALISLPLTCFIIRTFNLLRRRMPYFENKPNKVATLWARFFFAVVPGWHVTIKGRENLVPLGKTVIFVSNHQSMADVFMMFLLDRPFSFIAKESIFKMPIMGPTTAALRNIPLRRNDPRSAQAAMEQCEILLKKGTSVFLYPEGTRSKTGELLPFKSGAFRLSKKLNIPIQPLAVIGAKDLLEKGSFIPKSFYASVTVLPLMEPLQEISTETMAKNTQQLISQYLGGTPLADAVTNVSRA